MKKITIIGDVMVEPPFLQQAKKEDGYDFYTPIKTLAPIFEASDYVIGNLETPLAGAEAGYLNGAPCFYSMGNVTMSPCTFYQVPEALPEYGLCAHLYVSDKKIQRVTISIIKMVEDADTPLHVVPIDALYEENGEGREALMEDVAQVYQRVTGRELAPRIAKREYELFPAPQA